MIPQPAVLVREQHERAVGRRTRRATRLDEQHEREQPRRLGLVGHELDEQSAEPDRLAAEILANEPIAAARRVAFVEDEVDDGQHRAESCRQLRRLGHTVRDARVADLPLRTNEPLRHRRLGDEEGARDLGRRQSADQSQCERDLDARRERRMAAGEDQSQLVVAHRALLRFLAALVAREAPLGFGVPLVAYRLAAMAIHRAIARRGHDPTRRTRRHARRRPALERFDEGVLHHLLRDVDIAAHAHERRHRASVRLAERPLDRRRRERRGRVVAQPSTSPWKGRTSIVSAGAARA